MKITNHLIGTIGSDPRTGTLTDGRPYAGFRLAVNHDYFNSETGQYEEGDTSWYDVAVYGMMAQSVACSLSKGDPVLVIGRLRVREWDTGTKSGIAVEIVADAIGHNLRFGTGSFKRPGRKRGPDDDAGAPGPRSGQASWEGLPDPPAGYSEVAAESGDVHPGDSSGPRREEPAMAGAGPGSAVLADEDAAVLTDQAGEGPPF